MSHKGLLIFGRVQFVVLLVIASYLLFTPVDEDSALGSMSDSVLHLGGWLGLGFSLWGALLKKPLPYWPWITLFIYSCVVECVQHFLPTREFGWDDIVVNAGGIILAWLLLKCLERPLWAIKNTLFP